MLYGTYGCCGSASTGPSPDFSLMLRGLRPADMRRVDQVVAEVHDVHGRLAATVALLRRHGFTVRTARQHADSTVAGYRMVVPRELRLFYVYARRNAQRRAVRRRSSGSTPR